MADNRKYYYLKLKESYFDDDAIVLLESMQDGVIYSNILLKLYLKSLKNGGKLQLEREYPLHRPDDCDHYRQQVGLSRESLENLYEAGACGYLPSGALYSNIELLIGQSSTEERKRRARLALQEQKALPQTRGRQMSTISSGHLSTRKIEIEKRDRYRDRKKRVRNRTPRPRRLWRIPQCYSFRYGA